MTAKKLVNELTWSVSRDRLFRTCERAYYYQYYGSWGGWERDAPDRTRKLYILKNIKSLPMWAGEIVHSVIAESLRRYAMKKSPLTVAALQTEGRRKLRSGWLEAVNREWLHQPKKTNLQELYYGNGKTLPKEQTEKIRRKVNFCLENFSESTVLKEILAASYLNWKPVDMLDSFVLEGGLKVWCALDFAFVEPDGGLKVIDWKTGAERNDELHMQLACYAIYVRKKWHTDIANQRLAAVILPESARESLYSLDEQKLMEAQNQILESAAAMRAKLSDIENNIAEEENFAKCGNSRICQSCKFKEVCL